MSEIKDKWSSGDPYEYFMGRLSTLMAPEFFKWLNVPTDKNWLDVGCGTGALSKAIEQNCKPQNLAFVDPSESFIERAKQRISIKGEFKVGNVESMPFEKESFDLIVSFIL